ncbi:MAG: sugar phosphate isomerase/epimerase [Bryobacteraceae bacterium]|nr:sugar phosphate isomerase/epimerase [Bryobacteraceae bacterium]MDW8376527.1 sugar phosphate isomerase/epimerase family protein [Bryobacterales bacterium]
MIQGVLLHSVSYAGLWGQVSLSTATFLRKAAQLGFDGVELMAKRPHVSVLDYDSEARRQLRAQLEDLGLHKNILAGYTNLTADLEHGEVPQREIQVSYIAELARLARDLGCTAVRIFSGYENPLLDYSKQWRFVVETLREAAQRAADFGVVLGVQNHHDLGAGWESFRDLILEVDHPNCRAMFDAWAPGLHEFGKTPASLGQAASELARLMVHTTVADYQLRPRYRYNSALINYEPLTPAVVAVPVGEGFLDYRAFLEGLRAGGFSGTVAYEMCSPLRGGGSEDNLDRFARRFLEWIAPWRSPA